MKIDHLDHLVLTVKDLNATIGFYTRVLGMEEVTFGEGRKALRFGNQKINLHLWTREPDPRALRPNPGAADFCLITLTPMEEVLADLKAHGVRVIKGPVERTGTLGPISSVYVRDPDGNLVEIANPK